MFVRLKTFVNLLFFTKIKQFRFAPQTNNFKHKTWSATYQYRIFSVSTQERQKNKSLVRIFENKIKNIKIFTKKTVQSQEAKI